MHTVCMQGMFTFFLVVYILKCVMSFEREFVNIFLEIDVLTLCENIMYSSSVDVKMYESRIRVQCAWYATITKKLSRRNKLLI